MNPLHLRLAAHMLELYVGDEISNGCSDWKWPDWFPKKERGQFAFDLEVANSGNKEQAEEDRALYGKGKWGPDDFAVAAYCITLLKAAAKQEK